MADNMMGWKIRETKEPISPGYTMTDEWEVKEFLGRGSFGDVWLAEKNTLGIIDQSAIKIIRIPRDMEDIEAMRAEGFTEDSIRTELRRSVDNAVREIRTMVDLQNHPAIVPCKSFDVFQYEEDGSWEVDIREQFLSPLPNWINANGIKQEDVVRMGISLSDLLSVCEKEGILHRDIKPANIFVDRLNNFRLGDFGLARMISSSSSIHSKGVGTDAFMAPEVFNGEKYDHRADIYSLGLVMYWLLNGQSLPFASKDISRSGAITLRLSGEPIPSLPDINPQLDKILRKACDPNPNKRWKTAQEFHDALQSVTSPKQTKKAAEVGKRKLDKSLWYLFWTFTIGYLILNMFDSHFLGISMIDQHPSIHYPIVSFVFLGAFPLLSLTSAILEKAKISLVLSAIGLCCALVAEISFFGGNLIMGCLWLLYPLTLAILLLAIIYGKKAWMTWAVCGICLATIFVCPLLVEIRGYDNWGELKSLSRWNSLYSDNQVFYVFKEMPLSRILFMLAVICGINLLPSERMQSKV